jgi:iron-sulfur cluster repair protein YtfE (RIC family)
MKRHESLFPLSRDHHQGLVQAASLRAVGTDKSDLGRIEASERILKFWNEELLEHFREEEEILLPILARYTGPKQAEIIETLIQHVDIRRRIDEVAQLLEEGSQPPVSMLNNLGVAIHDHIRYEEGALFPVAEREVDEKALLRMNRAFRKREGF